MVEGDRMGSFEVLGAFEDDTLRTSRHHQCRGELRTTRFVTIAGGDATHAEAKQVVSDGLCEKKVTRA
jgi:hypothetical protein